MEKQPVKKKASTEEAPKTPKNYVVNIDLVKDNYAKNNPSLRPLTNSDLAKATGKNKQLFSDWSSASKKKPDTPLVLLKLCELGGITLDQLIVNVDE